MAPMVRPAVRSTTGNPVTGDSPSQRNTATGKPILVFDSGIGGLSVFAEIRKALPDRTIHYLADDGGFPYGDRSADNLVRRIVPLIESAIDVVDPALVVIACNTASTLVLPPLRARFAVPFVGTVPAIKPAAERSRSGHISVLATPATIARDYTRDLVRQFASHCQVRLVGAPDLAGLAERILRGESVAEADIRTQIEPCFVDESGRRTDIVVLACTHFPFLSDQLAAVAPWPVTWLDPAPAIARRVADLIPAGQGAGCQPPAEIAYLTGAGAPLSSLVSCFDRYGLTVQSLPAASPG